MITAYTRATLAANLVLVKLRRILRVKSAAQIYPKLN